MPVMLSKGFVGNLIRALSSCKAHARIGRANTGRERTERAIRAGMAIGTDDQIACANDPLFGKSACSTPMQPTSLMVTMPCSRAKSRTVFACSALLMPSWES